MSRRRRGGVITGLVDFTLVILTGGLWLVWMVVRYLRDNC
jgi:hypothetical protein